MFIVENQGIGRLRLCWFGEKQTTQNLRAWTLEQLAQGHAVGLVCRVICLRVQIAHKGRRVTGNEAGNMLHQGNFVRGRTLQQ